MLFYGTLFTFTFTFTFTSYYFLLVTSVMGVINPLLLAPLLLTGLKVGYSPYLLLTLGITFATFLLGTDSRAMAFIVTFLPSSYFLLLKLTLLQPTIFRLTIY